MRNIQYISERNLSPFQKRSWGTVIVLEQMTTRPFKKALAQLKKKTSTVFNEHPLSIREFMYRKINF